MSGIATMQISLRESRMVLERLMQVARVPEGLVASLRDCALYSAALGLGGFPALTHNLKLIRDAGPLRLTLSDECTLDAGGVHAWFAADVVVDLAVAATRCGSERALHVVNVIEPAELGVVAALSHAHGFVASIASQSSDKTAIRLRPARADEQSPLDRVRREGLQVSSRLWWELFHRSAAALAVDTVTSRRHAGPIIVADDGRVVGRQDDDETDISLLTSGANATLTNPAA